MLVIIPSYYCNNHCSYCMYHDLTYDNKAASIEYLIDQTTKLIDKYRFYGFAVGGGGNILELGYEYCRQLITQLEALVLHHNQLSNDQQITLMTNIRNQQDVEFLQELVHTHKVKLNISLNAERANNSNTYNLIQQFDQFTRKHIRISTVVLDSIVKTPPKQFLDYIDQLDIEALLINQFEHTTMTKIKHVPTEYQYFDFLQKVITEWKQGNYNFNLPQVDDFLLQWGICGIIDVVVDPAGIKIASLNHNKIKQMITIDNIEDVDKMIKQTAYRIFDPQCMQCKHINICDHKYTQNKIDPRICNIVDQLSIMINQQR